MLEVSVLKMFTFGFAPSVALTSKSNVRTQFHSVCIILAHAFRILRILPFPATVICRTELREIRWSFFSALGQRYLRLFIAGEQLFDFSTAIQSESLITSRTSAITTSHAELPDICRNKEIGALPSCETDIV